MPAPELTPHIPGDPLATITPLAGAISDAATGNPNASETNTANAQAPKPALFAAKHNGGPRWIVIDENAALVEGKAVKVGDFTGTKAEALAEAERLNAGGEPLVLDPQRVNEPKAATSAKPSGIDPATIKQPVLTDEGWLCPVPPVKE